MMAEQKYLVSVVIATYHRLDYLKITIDSILNQSYKNFEIVIVGDGHQQDVEDYVSAIHNDKVFYHYVEHCGYPAKARNFGIEKAKGEYIAFCDDDDLWKKEKLEVQITVMQSHLQIALSCTNRYTIDENGKKIKEQALRKPINRSLSSLLISNYITCSSVVVRRDILEKTGLFPDTPIFKAGEDYHLWIRVVYYGNAYFIDEPLVGYRVHTGNITTQLSQGARRNIVMFKDVFSHIRVPIVLRCLANIVALIKFFYYKLKYI
ncbi:MAG: glycosyltransferase [Prevotellaceae bacterium]|jgi:glycosyltransferase involved in cell wall biosynthesis|nr:glycosyltransferase [Prevotellaceae bacterium]